MINSWNNVWIYVRQDLKFLLRWGGLESFVQSTLYDCELVCWYKESKQIWFDIWNKYSCLTAIKEKM